MPCLTLGTSSVDFGTLSFTDPALSTPPFYDASPAVHLIACSTAPGNVFLGASDATTAGGAVWDVPGVFDPNICNLGQNLYMPRWNAGVLGSGRLYNDPMLMQINFGNPLAAGQETDVTFGLQMPCRGSAGAGGVATMTFSALAVLD